MADSTTQTQRSYAVLEAPSSLGLMATGVERLPERMRELGLAERVRARHAGRLSPPARDSVRDAETHILNAPEIAAWTPTLANAFEGLLDRREFPIVLGGDCTILLGTTLALKRRGRYGLLFVDGNADFFQADAEPSGEAASMDLALATGRGPQLLSNLEGRSPLVRAEDAVAFGYRDAADQLAHGSQPLPEELRSFDLETVRRMGVEAATHAAVAHVARPELDGFLIHVDADCLDDRIMPAVDFRIPDGFSWDELVAVLKHALASERAIGLEVTIYNPDLDRDGAAGRGLCDALVRALAYGA